MTAARSRCACAPLVACALLAACGPMRRPGDPTGLTDTEREYHRRARGEATDGGHRFGEFTIGGAMTNDRPGARVITPEGDAGSIAVAADAGVESGETAWLVAHINEPPDPLHPTDTMNVRTLSDRGADGIRAIAPVLRRGDARRVPYARRVIERVAARACRRAGGRDAVVRLVPYLELGRVPLAAVNDAGIVVWTRDDAALWPPEAIARLLAWADAGMPCNASASTARDALDGGAPSAASTGADGSMATRAGLDAATSNDP